MFLRDGGDSVDIEVHISCMRVQNGHLADSTNGWRAGDTEGFAGHFW